MAKVSHLAFYKFPTAPKMRPGGDGPVRFMTRSGGYVMARRPGCVPFVLSEKEWMALPDWLHAATEAASKERKRTT